MKFLFIETAAFSRTREGLMQDDELREFQTISWIITTWGIRWQVLAGVKKFAGVAQVQESQVVYGLSIMLERKAEEFTSSLCTQKTCRTTLPTNKKH